MPKYVYVYSTLTSGNTYRTYTRPEDMVNDLPETESNISINGGTNVATKHLLTPRGVMTRITEQELEILKTNQDFARHVKNGFITFDEDKVDPELKAADMKGRDSSAPLVPQDYKPGTDTKSELTPLEDRAQPVDSKAKK